MKYFSTLTLVMFAACASEPAANIETETPDEDAGAYAAAGRMAPVPEPDAGIPDAMPPGEPNDRDGSITDDYRDAGTRSDSGAAGAAGAAGAGGATSGSGGSAGAAGSGGSAGAAGSGGSAGGGAAGAAGAAGSAPGTAWCYTPKHTVRCENRHLYHAQVFWMVQIDDNTFISYNCSVADGAPSCVAGGSCSVLTADGSTQGTCLPL